MSEEQGKAIFQMVQDIAGIKSTLETMKNTNELAIKAMESASSAHHRIDELRDNQTWLWRTVIGGLIAGAIGLIWKVVGK